jgi:hypothetical protein
MDHLKTQFESKHAPGELRQSNFVQSHRHTDAHAQRQSTQTIPKIAQGVPWAQGVHHYQQGE